MPTDVADSRGERGRPIERLAFEALRASEKVLKENADTQAT